MQPTIHQIVCILCEIFAQWQSHGLRVEEAAVHETCIYTFITRMHERARHHGIMAARCGQAEQTHRTRQSRYYRIRIKLVKLKLTGHIFIF